MYPQGFRIKDTGNGKRQSLAETAAGGLIGQVGPESPRQQVTGVRVVQPAVMDFSGRLQQDGKIKHVT
jgi:hypothetical protein